LNEIGHITTYASGEKWVCIHTFDNVQPPVTAVTFCDKDGSNCTAHWLDKKASVVSLEIKNTIDATVKEEMQTNTKDEKNIGAR
jgi:hypothetical protein